MLWTKMYTTLREESRRTSHLSTAPTQKLLHHTCFITRRNVMPKYFPAPFINLEWGKNKNGAERFTTNFSLTPKHIPFLLHDTRKTYANPKIYAILPTFSPNLDFHSFFEMKIQRRTLIES